MFCERKRTRCAALSILVHTLLLLYSWIFYFTSFFALTSPVASTTSPRTRAGAARRATESPHLATVERPIFNNNPRMQLQTVAIGRARSSAALQPSNINEKAGLCKVCMAFCAWFFIPVFDARRSHLRARTTQQTKSGHKLPTVTR